MSPRNGFTFGADWTLYAGPDGHVTLTLRSAANRRVAEVDLSVDAREAGRIAEVFSMLQAELEARVDELRNVDTTTGEVYEAEVVS